MADTPESTATSSSCPSDRSSTMLSSYDWGDTDSLLTVTDSIREELYRVEGDRTYNALDHPLLAYPIIPGHHELFRVQREVLTWGREHPGELNWSPDPARVDQVLRRSHGEQTRILKLGSLKSGLLTWSAPMADKYPWAQVIHLSTAPTLEQDLPPNIDIEIGSYWDGLNFPSEFFDLVDASCMAGFVPSFPNRFLEECQRVLRPGGCLLLLEYDNDLSIKPKSPPLVDLVVKRQKTYDDCLMASTWEPLSNYAQSVKEEDKLPPYSFMGDWARRAGFADVHLRKDEMDLTSNDCHPNMRGMGRQFLWLVWEHHRDHLKLDETDAQEMRALDLKLIEECPAGVLFTWYSVCAFKAP